MAKNGRAQCGRSRFEIRFSERDPDDVRLSWYVADAIEAGLNVSVVSKRLLLAWFDQQANGMGSTMILPTISLPGSIVAKEPDEGLDDDLNDPAVQAVLQGMDFDVLENKRAMDDAR